MLLAWVDLLRLSFATAVPHIQEGFVPAQHDTHSSSGIAVLQARCHELAAEGVRLATRCTYPFPDELCGLLLVFREGRLVVHLGHSLERVYMSMCPRPSKLSAVPGDLTALKVWADLVIGCKLSPTALRASFWLRSAVHMFRTEGAQLRCPYCPRRSLSNI